MKNVISKLTLTETIDWMLDCKFGVVLCCTLNEVVMAEEDVEICGAMKRADLLTPDGMPLVWYLKLKYGCGERVYGPDLMRGYQARCKNLKKRQLFIGDHKNKIYFEKIGEYVELPFKDKFTEKDYEKISILINKSRADIVWIGLGAEKQIRMADGLARHGVRKVMVTVGAAFDFISGQKKQAPIWVQRMGGEWLFRLMTEPRRLWRRYLKVFLLGFWYLGRE